MWTVIDTTPKCYIQTNHIPCPPSFLQLYACVSCKASIILYAHLGNYILASDWWNKSIGPSWKFFIMCLDCHLSIWHSALAILKSHIEHWWYNFSHTFRTWVYVRPPSLSGLALVIQLQSHIQHWWCNFSHTITTGDAISATHSALVIQLQSHIHWWYNFSYTFSTCDTTSVTHSTKW